MPKRGECNICRIFLRSGDKKPDDIVIDGIPTWLLILGFLALVSAAILIASWIGARLRRTDGVKRGDTIYVNGQRYKVKRVKSDTELTLKTPFFKRPHEEVDIAACSSIAQQAEIDRFKVGVYGMQAINDIRERDGLRKLTPDSPASPPSSAK